MLRTKKGFTLIELMIVVAIIAIIAAIAIPNLLRARIAANESAAIGALRTLSSSEATAQASSALDADLDGVGEFLTLTQLDGTAAPNVNPPFIDTQLGGGGKSGYSFLLTVASGSGANPETSWHSECQPISYASSGVRSFYVDESGVVRGSDNNGAGIAGRAVAVLWLPVGS